MHDAFRLLYALETEASRREAEELEASMEGAPPHVAPEGATQGHWRAKLDRLWAKCLENPDPGPPPPSDPTFVRPANLLNAFVHSTDTFPRGHSTVVRQKFLHSVGAVARISYRPKPDNRCRGILAARSEGILRVSNGNSSDQGGFATGVALKFPRTNRHSADMVFGPPKFEHTDTDQTIVTREQRTWLGPTTFDPRYRDIRTLFWIFDRIREGRPQDGETGVPPCGVGFGGRAVSVDPLYDVDQDGLAHDEPDTRPKVPIGLVMVPSEQFKDAWRATRRKRWYKVLPRIEPGLLLYQVYALWGADETRQAIGEVHLVDRFTTSCFGDMGLFFRHPPKCPSMELAAFQEDPPDVE